jgi:predicted RNA polymerase sigma factor
VAEAFATAVERWLADGVPPRPGAWLTTTANRKAIDRIRRENKREDAAPQVTTGMPAAQALAYTSRISMVSGVTPGNGGTG